MPSLGAAASILAIDLGTSGPKVALITIRGEVLGYEFEPVRLLLQPDGGAEQCPNEWWSAITQATRRLCTRLSYPIEQIAGISCTAQWSGIVPVSGIGEPLSNAIIWMDARGADEINACVHGKANFKGYGLRKLMTWMALTGGAPSHSGKDTLAHILYLKQHRPDVFSAAYKFLEPLDYLNLKLTGQFAATSCSVSLYWLTDNRDIEHIDYHTHLLQWAGLQRHQLPDLKQPTDILGPLTTSAAAELGLRPGIPVAMGAPDVHTAALGSGAVENYSAHLYVGTSSWLIGHVPFKKTSLRNNMASLPSALPGRYLLMNEQECAGDTLTFLRDNVFFPDDALRDAGQPAQLLKKFDALAAEVAPGSGKLMFTPWLYGERTPVEDHTLRGGFHNMSLNTTRAHMIRAVLEGVAFNARWLREAVEEFIGQELQSIHFIGGGATSALWCQIFADILQRPIRQMHEPLLANVKGAAMLGTVALGMGEFSAMAANMRVANTYCPNAQLQSLYDRMFDAFKQLYECNKNIYARLNAL